MSRLRKGKKFKGGSFAQTFRKGIAMNTPFSVVVAGESNEEQAPDQEERKEAAKESGQAEAVSRSLGPKDEIPSDTDFSREQVDDFFARKEAEEKQIAEQKEQEEKEKQKEEEAAAAEEEREGLSQGENIAGSFENEYDDGMSGQEKRAESKENKGQIRDAKKDAKAEAKDEFKAKKLAAKDLKGGDKRSAKKDARKDKRGDKKSIRKNKRSAKKSNRKAKRGK